MWASPFLLILFFKLLSQFMVQKSYLICIQINHVLNKTYTQVQHQILSQSNVMISEMKIETDGGCCGILKLFRQHKLIDTVREKIIDPWQDCRWKGNLIWRMLKAFPCTCVCYFAEKSLSFHCTTKIMHFIEKALKQTSQFTKCLQENIKNIQEFSSSMLSNSRKIGHQLSLIEKI